MTKDLPQHFSAFRALVVIFVLGAVVVGTYLWCAAQPRSARRLEKSFARAGKRLLPIAKEPPEGRAGRTVSLGSADLVAYQLYLRNPADTYQWLHVDSEGQVRNARGAVAAVRQSVELLLVPSGMALFVDDAPLLIDAPGWEAHWVSLPDAGAPPRAHAIPRLAVRDDFMRETLEEHPYARVTAGAVTLAQRGGGMPTTPEEEADPNFQRAANPFSIHASENGRLTYRVHAAGRWGDTHAEACFYFGIPKTGPVVDRGSLPTGTDLLVAMGPEDGVQVAFGWLGSEGCFALQVRAAGAPGTVLARWRGKRPPLTNWVKIGLECRQGCRVAGLLDGVPVLSADLPGRLSGPFHIQVGNGLAEFDDVRAWSLPTAPPEPTPLLIRSRQFAGKKRKDRADPEEFGEWASSSHAFKRARWRDAASGTPCAAIVTGAGILGEFVCESPAEAPTGEAPGVIYRIGLYTARPDEGVDIRSDPPACMVQAARVEGGWVIKRQEGAFGGPDADATEPTLVVGRRADEGSRFCVRTGNRWLPVSDPVPGQVHLAVIRTVDPESGRRFLLGPNPAHHVVRCTHLVHELFEQAPTAWNWVDGAFRMDCRWACQDQWNFMACGSTGLPCMTSKRVFAGDQMHDAFMSLRAVFPWEAGDSTFEYDPDSDRAQKFPILIASNAWYSRRDLNVSFCTDGRNPLSGYSVVFGGEDNTVTRLLRRGVTVAETRLPDRLFPTDESFMVVHYPWWRFTLTKTGGRVRVALDEEPLFDYTDPEPIEGGRLAFWSVRNGFAISRISSMADAIGRDPHAFYVSDAMDGTDQGWEPLVHDTVSLAPHAAAGLTQVTNTCGGGFFAVRHVPEGPVDLRKAPRLELPFRLGPGSRVSLHLEIGGKPFIVRIGDSPLAGMKALLVPGAEKGECFRLRTLREATVRAKHCLAELPGDGGTVQVDLLDALRTLRGDSVEPILTCLTVGNSSNAGYLMAGNGGNAAGSTYSVGVPTFR